GRILAGKLEQGRCPLHDDLAGIGDVRDTVAFATLLQLEAKARQIRHRRVEPWRLVLPPAPVGKSLGSFAIATIHWSSVSIGCGPGTMPAMSGSSPGTPGSRLPFSSRRCWRLTSF